MRLLISLLIVVFTATGAAQAAIPDQGDPVVVFPTPGTAPILQEGVIPCPAGGILKTMYDTDPGGEGALVYFRAVDTKDTLLVIHFTQPAPVVYWYQNGVIATTTLDELKARYTSPCDIPRRHKA